MKGHYFILHEMGAFGDYEPVSGKYQFGDLEHAKKRADAFAKMRPGAKPLVWVKKGPYWYGGDNPKSERFFIMKMEKNPTMKKQPKKISKKLTRLLNTNLFDHPKTDAMYKFLEKEAPWRVVGLSIEPDGVFIYTNSSEWRDDAGAGTFRADSETKAIKKFYELVEPGPEVGESYAEKRKGNPIKRFTKKHIATLKREYAKIDKIDPASPSYTRMIFLLDGLPQAALKQLANANIKFVSALARNRIAKGNPMAKKKRSAKQLANDKRLGAMAKKRGKKKAARKKNPKVKPTDIFKFKSLANGAEVLEQKGDVVLAKFRDEYVTWKIDDSGNAYWGHYHGKDLVKAANEFAERSRGMNPVKKTTRKKRKAKFDPRNKKSDDCQWFALCENKAVTVEPHPIIGEVPICQRCKNKYDRLSNPKSRKKNPVNYYQIFKCKGNEIYWLRGFTADKSEPRFTLTRGDAARYESQKQAKFIAETMRNLQGWKVGVVKKGQSLQSIRDACAGK